MSQCFEVGRGSAGACGIFLSVGGAAAAAGIGPVILIGGAGPGAGFHLGDIGADLQPVAHQLSAGGMNRGLPRRWFVQVGSRYR